MTNLCESSYKYALVEFIEEEKLAVIPVTSINDGGGELNVETISRETPFKVRWEGCTYLARAVQLAESKPHLDVNCERLLKENISENELPLFEPASSLGLGRRNKRKPIRFDDFAINEKTKDHPKKKSNKKGSENILSIVTSKYSENILWQGNNPNLPLTTNTGNKVFCKSCEKYKEKFHDSLEELRNKNMEICMLKEKVEQLENKVKEEKKKRRDLKEKLELFESNSIALDDPVVYIGKIVRLPQSKLNMCRSNNYSLYICDLMVHVFGEDILARSLLKGIKSRNTEKTNVLDQNKVNDIATHVIQRFPNLTINQVREVMRNKLNSEDKNAKRKLSVSNHRRIFNSSIVAQI